MLVKTYCAAVNGMEVTTVTVEVSITRGVMYHLTGLADVAVKESHDRIAAALLNNGYQFPVADITANLAPADLRKEGSSFDLPLAIAILGATEKIASDHLGEYMLVGELSLDGTLQPIKGALPIAIKARAEKFKGLIVPKANEHEAAVVDTLEVYGMNNIGEVISFLNDAYTQEPCKVDTRKEFYENQYTSDLDFADVRGQENIKRALEVAAAGSHNVIMIGPPGSGKSMMAKRLPSILPPLALIESLETTQIHSIAGKLKKDTGLITATPIPQSPPYHLRSSLGRRWSKPDARRNNLSPQRSFILRRVARVQQTHARSIAPTIRRPRDYHFKSQIYRYLPLQFYVRSEYEPLPLWLLWRYYAPLCLYAGADTALPFKDFGPATRPHRHTMRNISASV